MPESTIKFETRNPKLENRSRSGRMAGDIRDFKDLDVWQVARDLRTEMYKVARALPDFEKFALATQIRRAACSVTANIAEGFGRFSYQENVQFCRQARGSLFELRDHLTTCTDQNYIDVKEGERLDAVAQRVAQILNGYLRSTMALKAVAAG
jgi:four helix bundle protein